MRPKKLIYIAGLAVLFAAYGVSFSQMVRLRQDRPPETRRAQALALDPTLLKVVSGPFKGLMADYLSIKASVFMGGSYEVTEEDWEAVYTLFKQSLHLDPFFFQTAYYTQGLLSWRPTMHQRASDLILYHAQHRYWDWEPMFYVGFNHAYYLKDNDAAAKYLKLSSERHPAPPVVSSLAARMSQKSGQTLTAIALLKAMYEGALDENTRAHYAKRLEAHLAVLKIDKAIQAFEHRHSRRPDTLFELVTSGTIEALPKNPFPVPFQYDSDTGVVFFDENQGPFKFDQDRSLLPIPEEQ